MSCVFEEVRGRSPPHTHTLPLPSDFPSLAGVGVHEARVLSVHGVIQGEGSSQRAHVFVSGKAPRSQDREICMNYDITTTLYIEGIFIVLF